MRYNIRSDPRMGTRSVHRKNCQKGHFESLLCVVRENILPRAKQALHLRVATTIGELNVVGSGIPEAEPVAQRFFLNVESQKGSCL
jgi:hypothetical protein